MQGGHTHTPLMHLLQTGRHEHSRVLMQACTRPTWTRIPSLWHGDGCTHTHRGAHVDPRRPATHTPIHGLRPTGMRWLHTHTQHTHTYTHVHANTRDTQHAQTRYLAHWHADCRIDTHTHTRIRTCTHANHTTRTHVDLHAGMHCWLRKQTYTHTHTQHSHKGSSRDIHTWTRPIKLTNVVPTTHTYTTNTPTPMVFTYRRRQWATHTHKHKHTHTRGHTQTKTHTLHNQ